MDYEVRSQYGQKYFHRDIITNHIHWWQWRRHSSVGEALSHGGGRSRVRYSVNVNLLPYKVHDDRTCCMPTSAEPSAVSGHGNVGSLVHIGQ